MITRDVGAMCRKMQHAAFCDSEVNGGAEYLTQGRREEGLCKKKVQSEKR